ncbi:hypothetical protein DFH08DRAFT_995269 [Mycena albidolilacea]|uniref:GST C-terminal domain-containing protein n=1 Tax=Mycena albidolilacea TaxID=1033008 RepID=A0AAD7A6H9_9AGAR|nr:hypothetical protein DFH08DRAFT_995269 [Mycena albidolilacea]
MPVPDEQISPHATGNTISTVTPDVLRARFETVAVLSVCLEELDRVVRERNPIPGSFVYPELEVQYFSSILQYKEVNPYKGPYFLGDEFSLVDVAIVPFITRDYISVDYRNYSREGISAEWKQYADHVEQRERVLKTKSDQDKYAEVYGQYFRDEAQSNAAKAIRAGRVIP